MVDYSDYFYKDCDPPPSDPIVDSLQSEWQLLCSSPATISQGVCDRTSYLARNPLEAAVIATEGLVGGTALTCLIRKNSGELVTSIMRGLPRLAAITATLDAAKRIEPCVGGTWNDPANSARYQRELGTELGSMLVNYGLVGFHAAVGARAAMSPQSAFLQATSPLEAELPTLKDAVLRGLADSGSLESELKAFAVKCKLPKLSLQIKDDLGSSNAEYTPGMRLIEIESQRVNGPRSKALNTVAHEFSHYEQDVNLIRRLADELKIGKYASDAQVEQLQQRYEKVAVFSLDEDFARAVLKRRAGQRLSAMDMYRADRLINDEQLAQRVYSDMNKEPSIRTEWARIQYRKLAGENEAFHIGNMTEWLHRLEDFPIHSMVTLAPIDKLCPI